MLQLKLTISLDYSYTIPVEVGDPGQRLNLSLDTGSPDFWVWSSLLTSTNLTDDKKYFNVSDSINGSFYGNNTFSTTNAYGPVWSDTVDVGGLDTRFNPIETPEWIDTVYSSLTDVSGIFGLGLAEYDSEYPEGQQTWLDYWAGTRNNATILQCEMSSARSLGI